MSLSIPNINVPSPIQTVSHHILERHNVTLQIKREDLIHPTISGNKWRKLKGNLKAVVDGKYAGIITFGGAFSNHIHATAAACHQAEIPCIGIIRGEYDAGNPTLRFAKNQGMDLRYVSRSDYRLKEDSEVVKEIYNEHDNYLLVPEGGGNLLAYEGLAELGEEIAALEDIDMITVSAGTGITASGIIRYQKRPVTVFSSLKSDHLQEEISEASRHQSFNYINKYHFGGYGRTSKELIEFINTFYLHTGIPLDPIYNAKAVYGILDKVETGEIAPNTSLLHIHTGGLQGIKAYNYMAEKQNRAFIDIRL